MLVSILVPSLAPAAEEATRAALALGQDAITAADRPVAAASRHFITRSRRVPPPPRPAPAPGALTRTRGAVAQLPGDRCGPLPVDG